MPTSSEELADVVTQPGVNVVFFGSTRCRACQAALPLVLRLKADCPNARFVYASQSSCATAHRQYKADQLPQVLVFKDGAMVTQVAPSGGAMRSIIDNLGVTLESFAAGLPPPQEAAPAVEAGSGGKPVKSSLLDQLAAQRGE